MTRYRLDRPLPDRIRPPLRFRERGGRFEGEVNHPYEIIAMFEPVDVLGGVMQLVDRSGRTIVIYSDNDVPVQRNEYPANAQGLYYEVLDDV